ncbi:hypothetical protein ACWEQW_06335 [Streptomyces nigra]
MADEIRTFDAILDPARAQNLLTALYVMRADAARGARLDFALIQRWQQHVLAAPALPPLRSLPASPRAAGNGTASPPTHAPALTPASPEAPRTPSDLSR